MEEVLWVEKYRPKSIDDCILPTSLKETLSEMVDKKEIPNLLLSGGPGVGKTTVAKEMLESLNCDYIVINGSMNGNIDTLRNEIKDFASTISFTTTRKFVILDEADYLNAQSTQPALRNFMEEYSKNCGFILTCNFKNRIIDPLHSRCSVVEFKIDKNDKPKLAAKFMKRVDHILTSENVKYDKKVVAEMIMNYFPDWRRVINELQRYSVVGEIDVGILSNFGDDSINKLIGFLKNKQFENMRKWVGENEIDTTSLFRKLYDLSSKVMKNTSIPQLAITLADYQYKAAFVADHEINLVACLTEVMTDCEFK